MYAIENWSCFNNVIDKLPRTTNAIEAWHRTINSRSEISHPNIARFISLLQSEEEIVRLEISRRKAGNFSFRKKHIVHDENLRIIVENFEMFSEEEYFICLDKIIKWKF